MNLKSLLACASAASLIALGASAQPPAKPTDKPATNPKAVPPAKVVPNKDGQPAKDAEKAEPTLKVGDKAPAITVDTWVKGEQVKGFEKGKVYVVEFWATWCGPCIKAIPHLTELQKEHKEVVFMGIAGSERPPKEGQTDARLEKVQNFVKDQGDKMDYRVAYDSKRAMPKAWMEPAGRGGIPCTFIVDHEGKIAWIGHPTGMDEPLAEAVKKSRQRAFGAPWLEPDTGATRGIRFPWEVQANDDC